jgi:fatty-acyl-CoA synthase
VTGPATTVCGLLDELVEAAPGRPALSAPLDPGAPRWTAEELRADVRLLARHLLARGAPGQRVAVLLPNGAEAALLQLAVATAGMTLVPLNPRLPPEAVARAVRVAEVSELVVASARADDVTARLGGSGPRVVRSDGTWESLVEGADPDGPPLPVVDGSDLAQIQFTSGTSGPPKGVLVTHAAMTATARLFAARLDPGPGPWLNPMPMFHTAGNVLGSMGAMAAGQEHVVLAFTPEAAVRLVEQTRAAMLSAAPALLDLCLEELERRPATDLSALRVVFTGGQRVGEAQIARVEAGFGARMSITWGMTETCGSALLTSPADPDGPRRTTVGTPLPDTEVRVVDPDGATLGPGARGELLVRGPRITRGYLVDVGTVRPALDEEGWLRTGDLAESLPDGTYRIVGRVSDMIKTGGENVTPEQVESVLAADPGVREVAVVGVPDDRWGELVVACLALAPDASEADVVARLEERTRAVLAPHERPRRWMVLPELPRTASSKVQRHLLRERAAGA